LVYRHVASQLHIPTDVKKTVWRSRGLAKDPQRALRDALGQIKFVKS